MQLAQQEVVFDEDDFIVSKTDTKGRITYVNRTFIQVSGFQEDELLGRPHSVIRHGDMPRAVFKLLWDRIEAGKEIFAYVKNRCKDGGHYWVLAHVTASRDQDGNVLGFYSVRRSPDRKIVRDVIVPLYDELREIEENASDRREGLERSFHRLNAHIQDTGLEYHAWLFGL